MRVHRLDAAARVEVTATLSRALAARPEVLFAFLFGSFLDAPAFRDVDVAVWASENAPASIDVDLASQLSRVTSLPIDVRRINDAPLPFLFHALRGKLLCVRDEGRLVTLLESTARRYHDHAPLLRRATREAFAR